MTRIVAGHALCQECVQHLADARIARSVHDNAAAVAKRLERAIQGDELPVYQKAIASPNIATN
jgi:hypothetical protein